jgi:hypothetical protein
MKTYEINLVTRNEMERKKRWIYRPFYRSMEHMITEIIKSTKDTKWAIDGIKRID